MAKFSGNLGYELEAHEEAPGVWLPAGVVEKHSRGDIIRASKRYVTNDNMNDNVDIQNQISVIMDPFVQNNFQNLKYAVMYGVRWKIQSFEIVRPRLILTLGGVYNGPIPDGD